MPVQNGRYDKLSEDDIVSALEGELVNEFGSDIDLTESSVFSTLAETLAAVLRANQEEAIEEVFQSAFLDTADGDNLDRVVALIGLQRRAAIHATGVERFESTGPVDQDYVIQRGTTIQTGGETPVEFQTTEVSTLELVDSFEDGDISEYSGNTGSGTVVSDASAPEGSEVLELDATNGAHIYNDNIVFDRGVHLHAWTNVPSSTVPTITYGIDPQDTDSYYQIAFDEGNDAVRLERVDNGSVASTIDTLSSAGLSAGSYHEVEWDWTINGNHSLTVYDPNDNKLGTLGGDDNTYKEGHPGFKSGDANASKRFDWYTSSQVSANIRAQQGGAVGNVGPNSVTNMPSPPSGVSTATNLYATGDTQYTDTNQETFVVGKDRERDEELRARAENAVAGGGSATHDAIAAALVNETPGVTSVSIYENKTDTDNTPGGLPPYSFEAVVFGGTDQDVAKTLFNKKAVTSRDYSGVNGTSTTVTVQSDINATSWDIEFSRPTKVNVDMTLDLVIDDTYTGDDALRDEIVQYIGGTLVNGNSAIGLGVGEDVLIDVIADIVVGDDVGVVGLDQSVNSDPIETTPSSTVVGGLEVVDIGANEVAQTDATDASITINTRNP